MEGKKFLIKHRPFLVTQRPNCQNHLDSGILQSKKNIWLYNTNAYHYQYKIRNSPKSLKIKRFKVETSSRLRVYLQRSIKHYSNPNFYLTLEKKLWIASYPFPEAHYTFYNDKLFRHELKLPNIQNSLKPGLFVFVIVLILVLLTVQFASISSNYKEI